MTRSTRRSTVGMLTVLGVLFVVACGPKEDASQLQTSDSAAAARRVGTQVGANGQYADVNGLKMYYEIHGTGKPLVLLHGAFSQTRTDFPVLLPMLTKNRQVIAIEQQGHGHTADVDRPLTYKQMADDTAELLRQLKIENADFFGYSMGGGIALEMAINHPSLVRKFVYMGGAAYRTDGLYPELIKMESTMTADMMKDTPWKASYDSVAPNKADFPKLVEKIKTLDTKFPGWTSAQVRGIKAPALLIVGDADVSRLEHVVEFYKLLGGGVPGDLHPLPASQLAILPGTTHVTIVQRAFWLASMTNAFLDAAPAPAVSKSP